VTFGLEVFDAAGTRTLEVSSRLTKYSGTFSGTLAYQGQLDWGDSVYRGNINVPGLSNDGTWFAMPPSLASGHDNIISGAWTTFGAGFITVELNLGDTSGTGEGGTTANITIDIMRA
jgi:hypothetical protein